MKDTKALLKEAIADAKTVRETALAQAKLALEEAFTPRLQSMFQTKLQEAYDDEEELDEMKDKMAKENMMDDIPMEEETQEEFADRDNSIDEIDLDEILAELENELNEAKEEESEEEIETEEEVEDVADDAKEDEEEDKEVKDLSMDELESLIRDIISQETGDGEGYEDEMAVDAMDDMGDAEMAVDGAEEDFDLEEILAELMKDDLDERKKYGGNKGNIPDDRRGKIKKDTAEEEDKAAYEKKRMKEELEKTKAELEETLSALAEVRVNLQEVNLLNAKLLYTNKIFRAKNLNENQKVQVLGAFDKAATVKEVKLVFETLNNEIKTSRKSPVTESMKRGLASKSAGVAPKKEVILEADTQVLRWQKLAGIIKS